MASDFAVNGLVSLIGRYLCFERPNVLSHYLSLPLSEGKFNCDLWLWNDPQGKFTYMEKYILFPRCWPDKSKTSLGVVEPNSSVVHSFILSLFWFVLPMEIKKGQAFDAPDPEVSLAWT